MVSLLDLVGALFAQLTMLIPVLVSQPIPYQKRDPHTGILATIGAWYEFIANWVEFGISVAVDDAGAANPVAVNAVAADAVAAEMIKTSVLIILCQGLVNGLQAYDAQHEMVDSRTHIIRCRTFRLCLRVTSPMS